MLTMLAGDPKAGKKTLLEGLLRAMASGEDFLGRETAPATAVVVSEDTSWEFEEREALLGPAPERHLVLGEFATTAEEWDGIIERAIDACEEGGHDILVVDSLPQLTGLDQGELENDAAAVGRRLRPLWAASRRQGLAVVFTHHLSKRGRVRGSTAFEGTPDAIVTLHRRARETAFAVRSRSRSTRTPAYVRGMLDRGQARWRYGTNGGGAGGSRPAVWEALEAAAAQGATIEELKEATGASTKTVRNCLLGYSAKDGGEKGWVELGRVERRGSGRAGDPYRYATAAAVTNDPAEADRCPGCGDKPGWNWESYDDCYAVAD
jgi:hypothetical protein